MSCSQQHFGIDIADTFFFKFVTINFYDCIAIYIKRRVKYGRNFTQGTTKLSGSFKLYFWTGVTLDQKFIS